MIGYYLEHLLGQMKSHLHITWNKKLGSEQLHELGPKLDGKKLTQIVIGEGQII